MYRSFKFVCKSCGTHVVSSHENEKELCISCNRKEKLFSLKRKVTLDCEDIIKKGGHISLLEWDNKDWLQFAENIKEYVFNSELILED